MALTWIDAVFLAVLALSMLAGFVRGFVREALGLAAWVVALMVAYCSRADYPHAAGGTAGVATSRAATDLYSTARLGGEPVRSVGS